MIIKGQKENAELTFVMSVILISIAYVELPSKITNANLYILNIFRKLLILRIATLIFYPTLHR